MNFYLRKREGRGNLKKYYYHISYIRYNIFILLTTSKLHLQASFYTNYINNLKHHAYVFPQKPSKNKTEQKKKKDTIENKVKSHINNTC